MRKTLAALLAGLLTLTLAACGGARRAESSAASAAPAASAPAETGERSASSGPETEPAKAGGKEDTLIVYFSAANGYGTDAITSATPITDGNSSTGLVAEYIHDIVGGDVVKIVPAKRYPEGYDDVANQAKEETDSDARPEFAPLEVDPTAYKTVFIGYPMWWYTIPMVMETFFDTYDFSGVTIVPFNTHEGSGDGGTYETIREREPEATVLDGLAVRGGDASREETKTAVAEWLGGLKLD